MSNTYNIYKIQHNKLDALREKIKNSGLIEQKTIKSKNYALAFYFSEDVDGNKIWWWETYRKFFKDGIEEPKNIFYFGLLLCTNLNSPEDVYAVSLGKSHFYLSKFIQPDFGITLAVRMADENTVLLKKSRHFAGIKRQDVSSYERFRLSSYEPGESVDHLKVKASNTEIWGERNIIFADSIQMDLDKSPDELVDMFDLIDDFLKKEEVIQLPKLEKVEGELNSELDKILFSALKDAVGNVKLDEFTVYGVAICFSFHDYDYRLSSKPDGEPRSLRRDIGNSFDVGEIAKFLNDHPAITDVNTIRVQFKNDQTTSFTKDLKEVLDLPIDYGGYHYFLRNGDWHKFNQTFVEYLKRSLENIEIIKHPDLVEEDYLTWKAEKERRIAAEEDVDDKVTYRESYFNKKQCDDFGYLLLDRQLKQIQSIRKRKGDYRVEVADLYKDGEIISVKISEANHELIYNIEQSKDALELIKRQTLDFEHDLNAAGLWFVFEDDVNKITDFNSIQFLLAIESWRRLVLSFSLKPRIHISKHRLFP
jgi:uncharacterized protein (TIGR04141 family)